MRTRTKWMVAGGAAAVVLMPIAAVYGSTPLDDDLQRDSSRGTGVVIDGEAANRARAARTSAERAQAGPTVPASTADPASPSDEPTATSSPKATKKAKAKAKAKTEPSGKKTVSAASPVSQHTPVSPVSPNTPN